MPANPLVLILAGSLIAGICALELCLLRSRLAAWFLFGLTMGVTMLLTGIEAHLRRVRQRREIDRARYSWHQLGTAMAAAAAAGDSLVGVLQQHGYRSFEVRQWLLRHFEDQQSGSMQRVRPAVPGRS